MIKALGILLIILGCLCVAYRDTANLERWQMLQEGR